MISIQTRFGDQYHIQISLPVIGLELPEKKWDVIYHKWHCISTLQPNNRSFNRWALNFLLHLWLNYSRDFSLSKVLTYIKIIQTIWCWMIPSRKENEKRRKLDFNTKNNLLFLVKRKQICPIWIDDKKKNKLSRRFASSSQCLVLSSRLLQRFWLMKARKGQKYCWVKPSKLLPLWNYLK